MHRGVPEEMDFLLHLCSKMALLSSPPLTLRTLQPSDTSCLTEGSLLNDTDLLSFLTLQYIYLSLQNAWTLHVFEFYRNESYCIALSFFSQYSEIYLHLRMSLHFTNFDHCLVFYLMTTSQFIYPSCFPVKRPKLFPVKLTNHAACKHSFRAEVSPSTHTLAKIKTWQTGKKSQ